MTYDLLGLRWGQCCLAKLPWLIANRTEWARTIFSNISQNLKKQKIYSSTGHYKSYALLPIWSLNGSFKSY